MQQQQSISDEVAVECGLRALVWDGVFSQALGVLTGGTLLTGCALEFGASPAFIGVLAALPFFAQVAHVPAIILIEKLRRRRLICVATTIMARSLLLPLALVPFIPDRHIALVLLLAAFAVLTPLGAIGGCAWMSWTCDLVPHHRLGEVFGRRQLCSNVSGIIAALMGGAMVNTWLQGISFCRGGGYAGVFALAVAAAVASTWCLMRMPEVPMPAPAHLNLRALFAKPFKDANFRCLMTFLGCWQFVVNLALPFFPVFLIQHLQYGITTAIGLGIVGQLAGTAAVPFWGKLSDQWSNKSVIALCAPLFLGCLFGWALAFQPAPQHLTLPIFVILQLVLGAATAGLDLASGNIALKLAPQGDATVFLGANGLVKSLCAGCAPIVGGVLIERMAHWSAPLSLLGDANKATKEAIWNLHPCQILFVIAGLLGVFALTRLASVKEMGDIGAGAVLRSLRRKVPASELQAVSDTAGRPL